MMTLERRFERLKDYCRNLEAKLSRKRQHLAKLESILHSDRWDCHNTKQNLDSWRREARKLEAENAALREGLLNLLTAAHEANSGPNYGCWDTEIAAATALLGKGDTPDGH